MANAQNQYKEHSAGTVAPKMAAKGVAAAVSRFRAQHSH